MATVTGLTAERMLEIEAASVIDGDVLAGHLILTKHDGSTIDAGSVVGPTGPAGPGTASVVVSNLGILEPGVPNQIRAGRPLVLADFTTKLGLAAPTGLWNLGDLSDISGNARNLVNKGVVTFGKGILGAATEAAIFTGSTAQALYFADTGASDPFRIAYGTFGCWFKTAKRGTTQCLLGKDINTVGQRSWLLYVDTTNVVGAQVSVDGNTGFFFTGFTDVCDDRWHHAVITYDGSKASMYIDGKLETVLSSAVGPMFPGSGPFNIGAREANASTAANLPFFGRIDEAFVTSDVLTLDQIRILYAAKIAHGFGVIPGRIRTYIRRKRKGGTLGITPFSVQPLHLYDFTGGVLTDAGSLNNALTNNGAAVKCPGADGIKDNAFNLLAASTQYLSASDAGLPAAASARSMGCWFKTVTITSTLMGYGGSGEFTLLMAGSGTLEIYDGTNVANSSLNVCDGKWHFAVAVIDGSASDGLKMKLYIDGKLEATNTAFANTVLTGIFRIGRRPSATDYMNGQIDGAFVTNYAMTSDEVAKLYAVGSLSLGISPKNEGDHVEFVDATNLYVISDTLESQYEMDIMVAE